MAHPLDSFRIRNCAFIQGVCKSRAGDSAEKPAIYLAVRRSGLA
jgi:hypothetical protein